MFITAVVYREIADSGIIYRSQNLIIPDEIMNVIRELDGVQFADEVPSGLIIATENGNKKTVAREANRILRLAGYKVRNQPNGSYGKICS